MKNTNRKAVKNSCNGTSGCRLYILPTCRNKRTRVRSKKTVKKLA